MYIEAWSKINKLNFIPEIENKCVLRIIQDAMIYPMFNGSFTESAIITSVISSF